MFAYPDALQAVYSTIRLSQTLDTARPQRAAALLAQVGNPQARVPAIHIAGTKGKGSTAAMLAAALQADGLRVGLYTSPHLHTLRERVRVNGVPISQADFTHAVQQLMPHWGEAGFTEVLTALALLYFASQHVDIAVIEAHLGGRYDATQVVLPRLSVITTLDYDHTEFLGHTLPEIAHHKSGIIRAGVPVVCAPQPADALAVVRQTALTQGAPLVVVGQDVPFESLPPTRAGQSVVFGGQPYQTALLGAHQGVNLAIALAALQQFNGGTVSTAMQQGLASVSWGGRLELIDPVLLDIAHNAIAAQTLRQARQDLFAGESWVWVFGVKANKDMSAMLKALIAPQDTVIFTQVHSPSTTPPESLLAQAHALDLQAAGWLSAPSVPVALQLAQQQAQHTGARVCVAGSIFVVAAARALLLNIPPETGSAQ